MTDNTKELIQIAMEEVKYNGGEVMVDRIKISRDGNGLVITEH